MRTIAIMNQKGGVGKTTTSVNLAAALARRGKRVLLIDMDPQAHASLYLGMEAKTGEPSVYDVMTGDAAVGAVCRQAAERLWVVPSHLDLAGAEVELAWVSNGPRPTARRTIIRSSTAPRPWGF